MEVRDAATVWLPQTALCEMSGVVRSGGRIGQQLSGLFRRCGLLDVLTMPPTTFVVTAYDRANDICGLRDAADRARDTGLVSAAEAGDWLRQLEQTDRTGCFFNAGTLFAVAGRRA